MLLRGPLLPASTRPSPTGSSSPAALFPPRPAPAAAAPRPTLRLPARTACRSVLPSQSLVELIQDEAPRPPAPADPFPPHIEESAPGPLHTLAMGMHLYSSGQASFRVWAPHAVNVVLQLKVRGE